jgi:hypothetical protein
MSDILTLLYGEESYSLQEVENILQIRLKDKDDHGRLIGAAGPITIQYTPGFDGSSCFRTKPYRHWKTRVDFVSANVFRLTRMVLAFAVTEELLALRKSQFLFVTESIGVVFQVTHEQILVNREKEHLLTLPDAIVLPDQILHAKWVDSLQYPS